MLHRLDGVDIHAHEAELIVEIRHYHSLTASRFLLNAIATATEAAQLWARKQAKPNYRRIILSFKLSIPNSVAHWELWHRSYSQAPQSFHLTWAMA